MSKDALLIIIQHFVDSILLSKSYDIRENHNAMARRKMFAPYSNQCKSDKMSSTRGCYSCLRVAEFIQVLTEEVYCPCGPEKVIS